MANHLTIRMAWHDNKWSGKVCDKPVKNVYCTGIHSLLSARIQRDKNPNLEQDHHGEKLDDFTQEEDYFPPCYWSCNAFSKESYDVKIEHPFENVKIEPVKDKLKPFSVYTWPFRLSFNHSREKFLQEGKYPPDLEPRIKNFFSKFNPGETIYFSMQIMTTQFLPTMKRTDTCYSGCSLLSGIDEAKYFNFEDEEFKRIKKGPKMKNFPKSMWARQLHHDFPNWGVLLPYKEYQERIDDYPEEEAKLKEMRALIEEDSIFSNFKYVAELMDDDKCLYLLYKIRKSLRIVEEHGFVDISREKTILENLFKKAGKDGESIHLYHVFWT